MSGYLLVFLSEISLDLRKVILLRIVVDGQLFRKFLTGLFVVVVGVLPDVEIVGVSSFGQASVVKLPTP
jgi:hypothetical protein